MSRIVISNDRLLANGQLLYTDDEDPFIDDLKLDVEWDGGDWANVKPSLSAPDRWIGTPATSIIRDRLSKTVIKGRFTFNLNCHQLKTLFPFEVERTFYVRIPPQTRQLITDMNSTMLNRIMYGHSGETVLRGIGHWYPSTDSKTEFDQLKLMGIIL